MTSEAHQVARASKPSSDDLKDDPGAYIELNIYRDSPLLGALPKEFLGDTAVNRWWETP